MYRTTIRAFCCVVFAICAAAQERVVDELVARLAKADSYSGDAEHEGGGHSPTWLVYERLRATASLPELEKLLAHESPIVRNYAARGLADRKARVDWVAILGARIGDDVVVVTDSGCLHDTMRSGDLLFALAQERSLLEPEQWLDMAERLVRADSKLAVRDHLLRTLSFRAGMRPLLRERVDRGDDVALVALARMRQPEDVPRIVAALRAGKAFENAPALLAAALFPDERVAPPLFDMRERAFATAVQGNVWDLEAWVAAIVAQRSEIAAVFLGAFRRDVLARADRDHDGLLREQSDVVLRKVLAGDAGGPAFTALRNTVGATRTK